MVDSLASVAPILDSITSARTQETTQLEIGEWIEDSLAMFDLGYLDHDRLGRIEDNNGWFVSRLNADANPHVVNEPRTLRGNSIDLEGTHLQEVLADLYRRPLTSQQRSVRIGTIRTFPMICESSGFDTRTTRMHPPIAMTLTPTTSTTSYENPAAESSHVLDIKCSDVFAPPVSNDKITGRQPNQPGEASSGRSHRLAELWLGGGAATGCR